MPPRLHVPLLDVGGQSAGEVQIVVGVCAQMPTFGQLPPGLLQTELVYLHLPIVGQSVAVQQMPGVSRQVPDCSGQSESLAHAPALTEQRLGSWGQSALLLQSVRPSFEQYPCRQSSSDMHVRPHV